MASGKTHDWVTHLMVIPTLIVAYSVFECSFDQSVLIASGMWLGGIFLSPDLDTRSTPFYRWGPFRFIWWPYQWAVKHRSSLSHGLFVAPFFRLLYLTSACIVIYYAILWGIQKHGLFLDINARASIIHFFKWHPERFIYLGIGIWLGSLFHVILDVISSNLPFKRFKPFR
ncbi:MAG: metal-binding protein [Vampirovibrionales bacterium]|nr:metal-binding protein [Vampirovibrionales bacterium]